MDAFSVIERMTPTEYDLDASRLMMWSESARDVYKGDTWDELKDRLSEWEWVEYKVCLVQGPPPEGDLDPLYKVPEHAVENVQDHMQTLVQFFNGESAVPFQMFEHFESSGGGEFLLVMRRSDGGFRFYRRAVYINFCEDSELVTCGSEDWDWEWEWDSDSVKSSGGMWEDLVMALVCD